MVSNRSLITLLGAFAMIVKSSRTFVCTSDCSTVIPQSTALLLRAAGPRPELHPQPQPVLWQGAGQHLHTDQEPQLPREGQTQEAAAAGTVQYSTVQYSTVVQYYLERVKLRGQHAAGPWPTSVFVIFIPASSLFYPSFSFPILLCSLMSSTETNSEN